MLIFTLLPRCQYDIIKTISIYPINSNFYLVMIKKLLHYNFLLMVDLHTSTILVEDLCFCFTNFSNDFQPGCTGVGVFYTIF